MVVTQEHHGKVSGEIWVFPLMCLSNQDSQCYTPGYLSLDEWESFADLN
jgi:hypothetical protein